MAERNVENIGKCPVLDCGSEAVLLTRIRAVDPLLPERLGRLAHRLGSAGLGTGCLANAATASTTCKSDRTKVALAIHYLNTFARGPVGQRAGFAVRLPVGIHADVGQESKVAQKVIGLIGGMSWESSAEYYRIINELVCDRLGGLRSARCLMWSFDFGEIEELQHAGRWDDATAEMIAAAQRLERGGADFVLICTNTMHRMADQVQGAISLPLLHIADPTAERIKAAGLRRVGLLGTAFTMEQDF